MKTPFPSLEPVDPQTEENPISHTGPKMWKSAYKKSHFAPAFLFLSKERRWALEVLYAVCRVLDDAVDDGHPQPERYLEAWVRVFKDKTAKSVLEFGQSHLAQNFLEQAEKYQIPLYAMVDLVEKGVGVDLKQNRFQTPMDTEGYCYGVAGTVGIACLPIFGVPVDEAKDFAVRLGITVQWINTIRDVGTDANMGRIYLPLDHLEQFGYTEDDLLHRRKNDNFQRLIQYEATVAEGHFKRAIELMPKKWAKELLPARIMGRIYMDLLGKIKNKNFPVFGGKVSLNLIEKGIAAFSTIKAKI